MALGKTVWTLTPDAFESLLSSFDEDRERAGQKYEILRRKLLEFFAARGSCVPDELADETLNRVARKIAGGEAIENLNKYCYGVAKFLWMEAVRRQNKEPVGFDDEFSASTEYDADDEEEREQERQSQERRLECFEECLHKLPDETRLFIIEYYREEKGLKIEQRKEQAARLQTTLTPCGCVRAVCAAILARASILACRAVCLTDNYIFDTK